MEPLSASTRPVLPGRLTLMALCVAGSILAGCAKKEAAEQAATPADSARTLLVAQQPTAEPPFAMRRDSILRHGDQVMAHLRRLSFDTGAAADRRRLLKGPPNAFIVGPDAELAPEVGAAEISADWAAKGRVVARLTIFGNEPYPKLHLQSGVTYVCVRRARPTNPADSLWAFLIGTTANGVRDVDSLRLKVKPGRHNFARFIVGRADENACFPCNSAWCCTDEM